ncbi:cytochrome c [Serratia ureilytica]|uniref:c-type cytochrome n=1 Tax=Serratia ureilytica TaxID=300181 RepID=UPI0039B6616F
MKEKVKLFPKKIITFSIVGFGIFFVLWGATEITPRPGLPANSRISVTVVDTSLIERGAYLARVGDCVACHSMPGNSDFSGGAAIASPIGGMVPPNITPDKNVGIGNYTFEDFDRAVRYGIARNGETLYPAMPWTSYSRIAESDMKSLYAYFMYGVKPVAKPSNANTIPWPLSMRWPMTYWRWLFTPSAANPPQDPPTEPLALGAYYVNGLGHCGACHTPRALTLQEVAFDEQGGDEYLSGGQVIDGYFVPSLRGENVSGLGRTSVPELVELLKTGRTDKTATFGPMSDVITNSTQYMTEDDLHAMATYLRSLQARVKQHKANYSAKTYDALSRGDFFSVGASVYMKNCEGCHLANGLGYSKKFTQLALNSSVNSQEANGLIKIVLVGANHAKTEDNNVSIYSMPSFAQSLSDQEIADVLTFIRSSWGNNASEVSTSMVAESRKGIDKLEKTNVRN